LVKHGEIGMVFSSNVFLFLFLPIFLGLYYLSGQRYRNLLLLLASYVFYAWCGEWTSWRCSPPSRCGITGSASRSVPPACVPSRRNAGCCWAWRSDLCILGYFKYANFGVDSINVMMKSAGLEPFILTHVLLPIGISFYIFESISYIIDGYRGDTPATRNLIDFAAFVAIFPTPESPAPCCAFATWPTSSTTAPHTLDKFSEGCTRFMQGFIKKVFIADTLAVVGRPLLCPAKPPPPVMPGSVRWRTPRSCTSTSPATATWPSAWA
jgi:alginate O-acetyltransferase complex protein AlgI